MTQWLTSWTTRSKFCLTRSRESFCFGEFRPDPEKGNGPGRWSSGDRNKYVQQHEEKSGVVGEVREKERHGKPARLASADTCSVFPRSGAGGQLRSRALASRLRPAIRHKSKVHDQDIHTVIISEETRLPRLGLHSPEVLDLDTSTNAD